MMQDNDSQGDLSSNNNMIMKGELDSQIPISDFVFIDVSNVWRCTAAQVYFLFYYLYI